MSSLELVIRPDSYLGKLSINSSAYSRSIRFLVTHIWAHKEAGCSLDLDFGFAFYQGRTLSEIEPLRITGGAFCIAGLHCPYLDMWTAKRRPTALLHLRRDCVKARSPLRQQVAKRRRVEAMLGVEHW